MYLYKTDFTTHIMVTIIVFLLRPFYVKHFDRQIAQVLLLLSVILSAFRKWRNLRANKNTDHRIRCSLALSRGQYKLPRRPSHEGTSRHGRRRHAPCWRYAPCSPLGTGCHNCLHKFHCTTLRA